MSLVLSLLIALFTHVAPGGSVSAGPSLTPADVLGGGPSAAAVKPADVLGGGPSAAVKPADVLGGGPSGH